MAQLPRDKAQPPAAHGNDPQKEQAGGPVIRLAGRMGESPAKGPAAAVQRAGEAAAAPPPERSQGAPAPSKLASLSDASERAALSQPSYVMYDMQRARHRRVARLIFGAALAVVVAGSFLFPDLSIRVVNHTINLKNNLISALRHQKRKADRSTDLTESLPYEEGAPALKVAGGAPRRRCGDLMQTTAVGKLAPAERVDLAECYLLQNDPGNAEGALKPLLPKIKRLPESQLNSQASERTSADVLLTFVHILLKEGKTGEAGELLRGRCLRWEQSNTCVAKVLLLADRRVVDTASEGGIQTMFESRGTLTGKAQARLWLAGAQLAVQAGRLSTADQRYRMAITAAPKEALALRKQIYETEALELYDRGAADKLKTLIPQALSDLRGLDPGMRTKLKLLSDLITSPNKPKLIKALLTREDFSFRVRSDYELVEIVGPEALRAGAATDFLYLLRKTRDAYSGKYRDDRDTPRRLAAWEVRATLAQGQYEQAATALASYERNFGVDALSHHLRGVAYAFSSPNERYQLMATKEFQAALRLKRSWESLYALGVAQVRARALDPVPAIIKDLDERVTTPGQRYFADMLKSEWYLAKGNYPAAAKLLVSWQQRRPSYLLPRQLLLQLYMKTGKTAQAQAAEASLGQLAGSVTYVTSAEGFASPLGIMALAKRPLE